MQCCGRNSQTSEHVRLARLSLGACRVWRVPSARHPMLNIPRSMGTWQNKTLLQSLFLLLLLLLFWFLLLLLIVVLLLQLLLPLHVMLVVFVFLFFCHT